MAVAGPHEGETPVALVSSPPTAGPGFAWMSPHNSKKMQIKAGTGDL